MGASGAGVFLLSVLRSRAHSCQGKTTCLDVLAQRKNIGVISGDVLVDGRPLNSDFARGTAYGVLSIWVCCLFFLCILHPAEQMDVHEGKF